jgi:hypothetical protein
MKKLCCISLLMLLPLLGFAQDAKTAAPKKETISTYKVFPKDGHETALKAALAAHAQKFHSGTWHWRVNEVVSGPDQGSYMIVEGPNSWTELDDRGDLGPEHTKDYETNITPNVDTEKSTPDMYLTYHPDVSTVPASAFSVKTLIRHAYLKPGRGPRALEALKTWKKVWEKRGMNVGVWSSFYSGEPQLAIVYRLKNGWKDLDAEMMSTRKAFEEVGGPNAYEVALEELAQNVEKQVDEMIEFKPELSSK